MGCDIHSYAEKKTPTGWEEIRTLTPFDWRAYGMYGFLADVRNYSEVPSIAKPRGLPDDASASVREASDSWGSDGHTHSWLSVDELHTFDYNALMEDRRVSRRLAPNWVSGAETCDAGEGERMTYRAFLGDDFFKDLVKLREAEADRVVFWFDN